MSDQQQHNPKKTSLIASVVGGIVLLVLLLGGRAVLNSCSSSVPPELDSAIKNLVDAEIQPQPVILPHGEYAAVTRTAFPIQEDGRAAAIITLNSPGVLFYTPSGRVLECFDTASFEVSAVDGELSQSDSDYYQGRAVSIANSMNSILDDTLSSSYIDSDWNCDLRYASESAWSQSNGVITSQFVAPSEAISVLEPTDDIYDVRKNDTGYALTSEEDGIVTVVLLTPVAQDSE